MRAQLLTLVLLVLPLGACKSGVAYPERMYDEVNGLYQSHGGMGGLRDDVREDLERRWATVVRWHEEGLLVEAADKFWGAMVLTTSDREEHLVLAETLGSQAAEAGEARGNLAYAAAQDLLSFHRGDSSQRWGTHFRFNHVLGRYEIYPPVDTRTSDSERAAMGVLPLRELQALVKELNEDARTQQLRDRIGGFDGR